MGDRANFGIKRSNGNIIWVYQHWGGSDMLKHFANAINRAKSRWDDPSYATRIVVSELTKDYIDGNTGCGLNVNEIDDNEHSLPVVDFNENTVSLYPQWSGHPEFMPKPKFVMSITGFVSKFGGNDE